MQHHENYITCSKIIQACIVLKMKSYKNQLLFKRITLYHCMLKNIQEDNILYYTIM